VNKNYKITKYKTKTKQNKSKIQKVSKQKVNKNYKITKYKTKNKAKQKQNTIQYKKQVSRM
jgi:hypothetical protein